LVAANGSGKKSFERLKREEHALRDSIKRFSASDNRTRERGEQAKQVSRFLDTTLLIYAITGPGHHAAGSGRCPGDQGGAWILKLGQRDHCRSPYARVPPSLHPGSGAQPRGRRHDDHRSVPMNGGNRALQSGIPWRHAKGAAA
jgi:hypothetical protein